MMIVARLLGSGKSGPRDIGVPGHLGQEKLDGERIIPEKLIPEKLSSE
ncbi:MAG: hypothetical protein R3E60_04020 [Alphaproteobacteria bacterium]